MKLINSIKVDMVKSDFDIFCYRTCATTTLWELLAKSVQKSKIKIRTCNVTEVTYLQ